MVECHLAGVIAYVPILILKLPEIDLSVYRIETCRIVGKFTADAQHIRLENIRKFTQIDGDPLQGTQVIWSEIGCLHILVVGNISAEDVDTHAARAAAGNRSAFYIEFRYSELVQTGAAVPHRRTGSMSPQLLDDTVALNDQLAGNGNVIAAVVLLPALQLDRDGVLPIVMNDLCVAVYRQLDGVITGPDKDRLARPAQSGNIKVVAADLFDATAEIEILAVLVFVAVFTQIVGGTLFVGFQIEIHSAIVISFRVLAIVVAFAFIGIIEHEVVAFIIKHMADIAFAVCTSHIQLYRGSSAHIKHGCLNAIVFQAGVGVIEGLIMEEFGVITEVFTGIGQAILYKRVVIVNRLDYDITVLYRDSA